VNQAKAQGAKKIAAPRSRPTRRPGGKGTGSAIIEQHRRVLGAGQAARGFSSDSESRTRVVASSPPSAERLAVKRWAAVRGRPSTAC
jgi:hypothetical protein